MGGNQNLTSISGICPTEVDVVHINKLRKLIKSYCNHQSGNNYVHIIFIQKKKNVHIITSHTNNIKEFCCFGCFR